MILDDVVSGILMAVGGTIGVVAWAWFMWKVIATSLDGNDRDAWRALGKARQREFLRELEGQRE